jgi:hypothetical protein
VDCLDTLGTVADAAIVLTMVAAGLFSTPVEGYVLAVRRPDWGGFGRWRVGESLEPGAPRAGDVDLGICVAVLGEDYPIAVRRSRGARPVCL